VSERDAFGEEREEKKKKKKKRTYTVLLPLQKEQGPWLEEENDRREIWRGHIHDGVERDGWTGRRVEEEESWPEEGERAGCGVVGWSVGVGLKGIKERAKTV